MTYPPISPPNQISSAIVFVISDGLECSKVYDIFIAENENPREEYMASKNVCISCVVVGISVMSAFLAKPAFAYWQFIERPAGAEVKPSPRYNTQQECEVALRKAEAALKKAYPGRYPLVGSCEEFR